MERGRVEGPLWAIDCVIIHKIIKSNYTLLLCLTWSNVWSEKTFPVPPNRYKKTESELHSPPLFAWWMCADIREYKRTSSDPWNHHKCFFYYLLIIITNIIISIILSIKKSAQFKMVKISLAFLLIFAYVCATHAFFIKKIIVHPAPEPLVYHSYPEPYPEPLPEPVYYHAPRKYVVVKSLPVLHKTILLPSLHIGLHKSFGHHSL